MSRSNNEKCASAIFEKILASEGCRQERDFEDPIEGDSDYHQDIGQKLLLYTLASKHPAFSFYQRKEMSETARSLIRMKEGAEKIAVAAHSGQATYIREIYSQPINHDYPVRAGCAPASQSPTKAGSNPAFTLQVTWSNRHVSHTKHTAEDFVYLHGKVRGCPCTFSLYLRK